jgi:hypothetical protein
MPALGNLDFPILALALRGSVPVVARQTPATTGTPFSIFTPVAPRDFLRGRTRRDMPSPELAVYSEIAVFYGYSVASQEKGLNEHKKKARNRVQGQVDR